MATDVNFTRPKIGIVGGTGAMGSWFAHLVEPVTERTFRVGRRTDLTPVETARRCDVVVISVPIADTIKVIRELGPLISENALLMDLTSIKEKPVKAMLQYSCAEVVGAHPLFGTEGKSAKGQRMVLCPGRGKKGLKWLTKVLERAGIKVVVMDPVEHYQIMGLIQGVNHFSTLALGLCMVKSGFGFEEILNCSTRTFERRLDRIRSMVKQPAELFESLLMDNPWVEVSSEEYLDTIQTMLQIIRSNDREAFGELFKSLGTFLNSR
jgi:prephenate dehydrogenase